MERSATRSALLGTIAAGALLAGLVEVQAGAFALREQGAWAQGLGFAGVAAGAGGLSAMYWNPATITMNPGWQNQWNVSGIIPYARLNPVAPTPTIGLGASGNLAESALVPATYTSYQFNDYLWLGLSVNAPFGLSTTNPFTWAGQTYGRTSQVKAIGVTPTIGIRINDYISLGFGLQIMKFETRLTSALATIPNSPGLELTGHDTSVGATAGVTFTPFAGTDIGVGYRSQVRQDLKGELGLEAGIPGLPKGSYRIRSSLTLPDQVTVGIRQRITPDLSLMAGFEWTNWSKFGTFPVCLQSTGVCPAALALAFRYRDGYFVSGGAEYRFNPALTLRAGVAYEKSPITNAIRSVRLPDSDRVWVSAGGSYKLSEKLSIDVAYSHIFGRSPDVRITSLANPAFNGLPFVATGRAHVDIVSVGVNYRWDDPKVVATNLPLVRKY